jgi:hypothetical protein
VEFVFVETLRQIEPNAAHFLLNKLDPCEGVFRQILKSKGRQRFHEIAEGAIHTEPDPAVDHLSRQR